MKEGKIRKNKDPGNLRDDDCMTNFIVKCF